MRSNRLALFISALLALGLVVAVPVEAQAAPLTHARGVALGDVDVADSETRASQIAVRYDHPVAVDDETTETTIVHALPDGSFEFRSTSVPERVQQEGKWVPVDTTLRAVDHGYFAPRATTVPVEFSGGGSSEMARIQAPDGSWFSEELPGFNLPGPTIDGDTAIYYDVLPGIDLRLTAHESGMSEVLAIESPEAAANPDLDKLRTVVIGAEVSFTAGNGAQATTSDFSHLVSSAPVWWDSTVDGSDASAPAPSVIVQPVDRDIQGDDVSLDIDSLTAQHDITYPLFVDPDWSSPRSAYWFIDSAYPSTSYLNGAQGTTSENVGYISSTYTQGSDGRTHKARTFWRMKTSGLAGKIIKSAVFNTTEVHSFNCTASRVDLWRTTNETPGSTWNDTPGTSGIFLVRQSYKTVAYGYSSSCPQHAVGFTATEAAKYAAEHNSTYTTFALKAYDETDSGGWKRFSPSVSFVATYDTPPNTPANPRFTTPVRSCGTETEPVVVNNLPQALTLTVDLTDPETADDISASFEVQDASGTPLATQPAEFDSTPKAPGPFSGTIPAGALVDGEKYSWTATAIDEWGMSSVPASSPCWFLVDNSAPGLVSVIDGPSTGTVGQPMQVQFFAPESDDVAGFVFWWERGTSTGNGPAVPVAGGGVNPLLNQLPACDSGRASVRYACATVDPLDPARVVSPSIMVAPIDTLSTLWVATYDQAGNVSADAANESHSTGLQVAASADTTNVNYSAGHGWLSSDTATSAPWPSSFAERPYSQPTTVALDRLPEAATSATFTNPGWVETFQSVNAAATRWGFTAGTSSLASGFTLDEPVAQVLSLNSGSTAPTGMWRLCSIPVTGGGNLMSATAGTSCPYSGVALGYVWTASTVPTYAEGDVLPIIRCHKGTSTANWISYTIREGATCASGFTLTLLGYGLRVGGLQTTSPVVDAAGSFSVSAQMLPAAPETQWTAIAGRTSTNVSFTLGVDAGGFWQFCVEGTCVTTAEAPDLSQGPVFVTGIRDVANDQIRIALKTNVDVQAVGYLSDSSGSLPSTLLVQSGFSDLPTPPQPWLGAADQISVFPGVVSSTQQQRLSGGSTPQP